MLKDFVSRVWSRTEFRADFRVIDSQKRICVHLSLHGTRQSRCTLCQQFVCTCASIHQCTKMAHFNAQSVIALSKMYSNIALNSHIQCLCLVKPPLKLSERYGWCCRTFARSSFTSVCLVFRSWFPGFTDTANFALLSVYSCAAYTCGSSRSLQTFNSDIGRRCGQVCVSCSRRPPLPMHYRPTRSLCLLAWQHTRHAKRSTHIILVRTTSPHCGLTAPLCR